MQGGEEVRGPLTEDELQRLRQAASAYVADTAPDAALRPGSSMMFINAAFQALKDLARGTAGPRPPPALHAAASPTLTPPQPAATLGSTATVPGSPARDSAGVAEEAPAKGVLALREENGKLRLQVQQRDNEISILVSMLKKREATIAAAAAAAPAPAAGRAEAATGGVSGAASGGPPADSPSAAGACPVVGPSGGGAGGADSAADTSLLDLGALLDRNRAFEMFRKSYRRNAAIETSKVVRALHGTHVPCESVCW